MSPPSVASCLGMAMAGAAACAQPVSPEPIGDYSGWKRFDVQGPAPGHGDTYRIIYANPIASDPDHDLVGGYADGAILLKEVRASAAGAPGELRYLAIMRRAPFDPAFDEDGGWMFTQADAPGSDELLPGFCWRRCHAAAPYAGAWYDYRR